MNDQTKKALLEAGIVSGAQIAAAEAGSGAAGSFDRALMKAAGLDENKYFQELSKIYKMPYISLKGMKIPPGARLACSEACIRRWNIFPVEFSPKDGLMTVAVGSPEHAERIERIFKFLMEPYDVGFLFTDECEIPDAVASECQAGKSGLSGVMPAGSVQKNGPGLKTEQGEGKRKIAIPLPKPQVSEKEKPAAVQKPVQQRAVRKESHPADESVSEELVVSLTSAVSLLVNAHLGSDPAAVSAVKERVRYCQLAATRLALKPIEATRVILAGWLSALSGRRDVIRQFICPYDLESIIFAEESARGLGIEALILSLVKVYQDFRKQYPEDAQDVGLTRRGLFMTWPAASKHQDILETFLQVLMDEQFVDKLGKHSGRVVMFAPGGTSLDDVESSFERSGYAVKAVSSFDELDPVIQGNGGDVIIVCASGDGRDALSVCRRIKESAVLSSIPLMAAISEGATVRGAEFLRAGADDFIAGPVDLELLLLKAEKLMNAPSRSQSRAGVNGSLTDMSFSDLVQVLSAGGKSMDVSVTNDDKSGRIVLRAGNVVHAESGAVKGEQAFYELMQWKVGQFSMSECQEFPETTVTASTMSLLMEGARIADESAVQL